MRDGLRAASSVEDPALQREAIDHAIGEADAATRIFNVLLGMARAEAGVGKETFDTLDLSSLVQDLAELFGPLAEEKDQALIVDAPTQLIRGQAALLKQAIGNLMQNAIKYTQPGGRISIRLERHQDSFAVLVVEDNGPGIPEAERAQAVQPFGRLARDRDTEGSGLGLSLVAACIKLHDGTLTLGVADPASETHPGLRVTLTLPIVLEPRVLKLKTN
jgi:signal transduction histidine kinase